MAPNVPTTEEQKKQAYEKEKKVAGALFQEACTGTTASFLNLVNSNLDGDFKLVQQYKDANKRTPLHFAAHSANINICKLIIDKYPTLFSEWLETPPLDADSCSPFALAVRSSNADITDLFLSNSTFKDQIFPSEVTLANIYHAASAGVVKPLQILLDAGGKQFLSDTLPHGTPLHGAIFSHNVDCVELLLNCDETDPNKTDPEGISPLMVAVATGSFEITVKLLESNSRITNIAKDNSNVFHTAVGIGKMNILELLLAKLPSKEEATEMLVIQKNSENVSALNLSVVSSNKEIFKTIISKIDTSKIEPVKIVGPKGESSEFNLLDFDQHTKYIEGADDQIMKSFERKLPGEVSAADKLKMKGNEHLKKERLDQAVTHYSKSIKNLESFLNDLKANQNHLFKPANKKTFEEKFITKVSKPLSLIYNNMSLSQLKLYKNSNRQAISDAKKQEFLDVAISSAEKAIKLDEANMKAYYRAAQAYDARRDYADAAQSYYNGYTAGKKLLNPDDKESKVDPKLNDEIQMMFELFQESVAKGKAQEKRKKRLELRAQREKVKVSDDFDFNIPVEVPIQNPSTNDIDYKTLYLKFNRNDNEAQVAGEFIRANQLHESLIQRIAKHIFEAKQKDEE